VEAVTEADAGWDRLDRFAPEVVLCDVRLRDVNGLELLRRIKEAHPDISVVMITAYGSIESAVAAMKAEAADYLAKPFNPEQLREVVAHTFARRRNGTERPATVDARAQEVFGERIFLGRSDAMRRVFETGRTLAATDSSVLITGESGTGKDVLARFIHAHSVRRQRAFVTVNCAAIPAPLLESEFFGHRRGAFTGAVYNRRGSFELADGGTLFLDEIGEMPLDMQVKILRSLEERQVRRVGSEETVPVNIRIIAATNKDLGKETKAGRFREDLFWRLNVVHLAMPALRDRPEDIPALVRHFIEHYAGELKKPVPELSREALDTLTRYDWPGNVREVRNAIERAVVFVEPGKPIHVGHLPATLREGPTRAPRATTLRPLRDVELQHIRDVLDACGGNRTRAAEILRISPLTLWRRLGREQNGKVDEEQEADAS
jgi:two-component system, NtrC family, response regulator HydG